MDGQKPRIVSELLSHNQSKKYNVQRTSKAIDGHNFLVQLNTFVLGVSRMKCLDCFETDRYSRNRQKSFGRKSWKSEVCSV